MTLKQFIKNLTIKNIGFTIQGYWRRYISKDKPTTFEEKVKACEPCWDNGECLSCGCDIIAMFMSDKPCPDGKFK